MPEVESHLDTEELSPRPLASNNNDVDQSERRGSLSPTRLPFRHSDEALLEESVEEEERRANERAVADAAREAAAEGDYDVGYNVTTPKIFKKDFFKSSDCFSDIQYQPTFLRC